MSEKSASPSRNGLAQMFSKSRNRDRKGKDSTTNSLRSSESDGHLSLRRSTDGSFDRASTNGEDGDTSGVKKLVGKTIGRRRRKKQELAEEQLASEEVERGRSVAERGTLENETRGVKYQESFDDDDVDSRSSLITFDDEPHDQ